MDRLVLTADQIYSLAYLLKAKYLDSFYITLAGNHNDNELWLSESVKSLVSQGILTEDFSGDISIESEYESLITPIFRGTKESSLEINIFGDDEGYLGYRFHFYDGRITMTKTVNQGFEISNVTEDDVKSIVNDLLPSDYSADSLVVNMEYDSETISRVFVVKNSELDSSGEVSVYIESEGTIYFEDGLNNKFSVSLIDFETQIYKLLMEN